MQYRIENYHRCGVFSKVYQSDFLCRRDSSYKILEKVESLTPRRTDIESREKGHDVSKVIADDLRHDITIF